MSLQAGQLALFAQNPYFINNWVLSEIALFASSMRLWHGVLLDCRACPPRIRCNVVPDLRVVSGHCCYEMVETPVAQFSGGTRRIESMGAPHSSRMD